MMPISQRKLTNKYMKEISTHKAKQLPTFLGTRGMSEYDNGFKAIGMLMDNYLNFEENLPRSIGLMQFLIQADFQGSWRRTHQRDELGSLFVKFARECDHFVQRNDNQGASYEKVVQAGKDLTQPVSESSTELQRSIYNNIFSAQGIDFMFRDGLESPSSFFSSFLSGNQSASEYLQGFHKIPGKDGKKKYLLEMPEGAVISSLIGTQDVFDRMAIFFVEYAFFWKPFFTEFNVKPFNDIQKSELSIVMEAARKTVKTLHIALKNFSQQKGINRDILRKVIINNCSRNLGYCFSQAVLGEPPSEEKMWFLKTALFNIYLSGYDNLYNQMADEILDEACENRDFTGGLENLAFTLLKGQSATLIMGYPLIKDFLIREKQLPYLLQLLDKVKNREGNKEQPLFAGKRQLDDFQPLQEVIIVDFNKKKDFDKFVEVSADLEDNRKPTQPGAGSQKDKPDPPILVIINPHYPLKNEKALEYERRMMNIAKLAKFYPVLLVVDEEKLDINRVRHLPKDADKGSIKRRWQEMFYDVTASPIPFIVSLET